ncbi:MAG: hypothetical protein HQ592_06940, partial [Planctomycetes bacterium]|nr:hypothetical protein [Planctomycetota bacterium]
MVELSIDAPAWLPPGGGDFVVTVGIGEVTNLVGYQIKLDFYDNATLADVFTVLATSEGELFAGREYCSGDVADGRAGVLLGGGVSGSGSFADFVVRYAPRSRGEYYVSLRAELLDADGRWISWRCDPIAVQVGFGADPTSPPPVADSETLALGHPIPVPGTPLYCDVNGDGFVNILDMMLVNNYFNMEVEGRLRYADVTPDPPDGVINILDMIAVQNRLGFSTPYSADDFEYDPDIKDQFFEWDTRSLLPLVIEVTCTISPDVPLVGDIVWRVSNGSVTGPTFDPETNVASATILVAGASFEVTVYNRGEIIGEDEVDFDVYTPPQVGEEHVHVYMYDLSKGLAGLPDRENNEYWGVFGKPEEVMAAEIEYRCNYFPGPTHVHSLTVTWDEALVVDVTFGEDHLANGVPFDDFPDPPDADYNNILSVDIALPDGPSGSVAPNLILADIEGDYGKDPLIYTTCLIEDITAPKLVPWNGWDNMLELSGKPEQSPTDELPDLGAEMLVRMTPSDPLVRLVIDDSDFDGLVLFDDNYEEVFRRIDLEELTDHYYVPGPDSGTDFSAIMFSTEESAAFNDKSITVSYHNPYGYNDDGNPVDSVTSDYTVVRPDIDVDTDGDDLIVEEDDDELELETTICVPLATEWDEMTPAKIALRPATQQLGGEIKLKVEGDGKIRVYEAEEPHDLIMNDDVDEQDVWDFVLSGEDDVLIQGIKAGYVELFLEYTNGGTFRTYDKIKLLVGPDIDIDSDNDNNFDDPERTWEDEEQIEDEDGDPDLPGKIVVVNDGDVDDDGIPDFADGYDRDPADPEDNLCPGLQFVPVILEISEPPDASMWFIYYVKVRLTYDSSDPAQVTKTPEGEYQLPGAPEGSLRLWTEPGADARNKNSAKNGGDFVPGRNGGDANVFDATALGFTRWMKPYVVTLYLEAVKPSAAVADKRIKFEVDLDGDGDDYDWTEDAVRVTIQQLDLDGLKVYDPKLDDDPLAEVKYTLNSPQTSYSPRIELTVMDGTEAVACLVRKVEASPPLGIEVTKMWDGKWGIEKDGTDTPHKDSYADPKQYVMEANLYLDGTEDSPLLFT